MSGQVRSTMENNDGIAIRRAEMPANSTAYLNPRNLREDNRYLAELLVPGMSVLDIGCGTGTITRGIAEAVAPSEHVVGFDINEALLAEARRMHSDIPNLSFVAGDL